ncbi:D-alanyl-lipoteichoic acid biosynthesis protein DltD [Clostridium uliginosum]|uniref:Protein DltD n=1 Tax=Clostridium uliginosum TaxID=119641 RepID=A0A1I1SC69_9CLOT|nr:D-alanyl-lipoteichoic acid biosynthesis protein DltD [Clostridium uliginosum]SFD44079.1 D-alanine transfer protein [Clostridium uliginosum]
MKKIFSLLIPIVIAILTTIIINSVLDKKLDALTKSKDISLMGKKFSDSVKDKSALSKELLSNHNDLFLLGSSEMGIDVPQNPLRLFPFNGAEYNISCFGRPYSQDLQQATYLGTGNIKENQKVAYVLSIQWFEVADAISPYNFAVNFSDVQFYKFLENPKISEENKQYYAKRVGKLLRKSKKYPEEALYATLYANTNPLKKIVKIIFDPYYKTKKYLADIKDKALIYEQLKKLPDKDDKQKLTYINWKSEYSQIKEQKKNTISTNQFHLEDKYYDSHLKNVISNLKDQSINENLMNSKEMDDYKFFLSVCKELNIKPYIILPPVNGWYYDYVGLSKEKRDEYYNVVTKLASENGFEVLNLQEYEYKQGFLTDPQHLGEEGWLKVSEEIYKHFKK